MYVIWVFTDDSDDFVMLEIVPSKCNAFSKEEINTLLDRQLKPEVLSVFAKEFLL